MGRRTPCRNRPGQQSLVVRHPTALYLGIVAALLACQATQIIQTVDIVQDTLPSFSTEVTDPKYIVAVDTHGSAAEDTAESSTVRSLSMRDSSGRRFTCLLPENVTDPNEAQDGLVSRQVSESNPQKTPGEVLGVLDTLCLYRIEDWWTYELCYKRSVRQFHKEGNKVVSEYDLGSYNAELSNVDELQVDDSADMIGAGAKYVMQVYDGGEPCDITGQARATEVRFVCAADAKDAIASIREAATCRYTLVFATPRLCAHPGFVTPEAPVHHILCSLSEGAGEAGGGADAGAAIDSDRDAAAGAAAAAGESNVALEQGGDAGSEGLEVVGLEVSGSSEGDRDWERGTEGPGSEDEGSQEGGWPLIGGSKELEVNVSAPEGPARDAHGMAPEGIQQPEELTGELASGDEEEANPVGSRDAASTVGPPMPPAQPAMTSPDNTIDDEEEDEEFDIVRTGMYAEL